ncbi:MAG: UvrD-helicase domain-containing protein [Minisyncoccia bacterium]
MSDILKNLNKEQQEAVTTAEGPVLIIAGAGSGKTRALTHRIAYLIEQGVNPKNILALTFTNKAAEEMKNRVYKLLNPKLLTTHYSLPTFLGTFHSFAAKILRQEIHHLGYSSNFTIYDDSDSLAAVKEIMAELAIDPDQFKPGGVCAAISKQKNELVNAAAYSGEAGDFYAKIVLQVFERYETYLKEANALDFDDLLMLAVELFKKLPDVLEKYQDQFRYILVDEYQDTNRAQYILLKLLAKKHKNLCVVGDDWQCFPPTTKITTTAGSKPIESLVINQKIISANGVSTSEQKIKQIKKFNYKNDLIKITTTSGRIIKTTPNHIFFAKFKLNPNIYFVYLMYATRLGYRIGIAKGARYDGRHTVIGLHARANQERADKMWVLEVTTSKEEATLQEQLFSIKYGIPTMVFSTYKNRPMKINQELINRLYQEIPTRSNAQKLMSDLSINPNYPHFLPQGTTRKGSNIQKIRVNLTLFGDPRITASSPWGLSRLAINTSHKGLKNALKQQNWPIRKGKLGTWRIECSRLKYSEAENLAGQICHIAQKNGVPVELKRSIYLKRGIKKYNFQPASHLRPTMLLPVVDKGIINEEEIIKVEKEPYSGLVYDLNIENTHNYIAEGFVVHNSIYAFRGANFRNILTFEKDYPEAKIVFLEENYRSTQNILDAAHAVIQKNVYKTEKKLWTRRDRGGKIKIVEVADEIEEGTFIAGEIKKILALEPNTAVDLNDFVVLYRTNAQSRAIEEAMLQEGWPYRMVGAVKFYERREIKDILCYLRFVQNEKDLISLKRIINTPPRGLGKSAWDKITLAGSIENIAHPKIKDFLDTMAQLRIVARHSQLADFIKTVLDKIQYKNYCLDGTEAGQARWENVLELLTVAAKFNQLAPPQGITDFLEEITLTSSTDDISEENGTINLMTLHSAKGLEFPVVFVAGAEEGLLPHSKSAWDSAQMEEERRLAYVGITRAKEKAYLIFTRRRSLYGRSEASLPSRFLNDIPIHLVEYQEYDPLNDETVLEI